MRLATVGKADAIRDDVYRGTRFALTRQALLDEAGIRYYMLSRRDIDRVLASSEKGLWCGGVAWRLFREYERRGFPCGVINFGWTEFSHVVTVVGVSTSVGGRMIMQDATFNHRFNDQVGNPALVTSVVRAASLGTFMMEITTDSGPTISRPTSGVAGDQTWAFLPDRLLSQVAGSHSDMRLTNLYPRGAEEALPKMRPHFELLGALGLPRELHSIFAYPQAVATRATQRLVADPDMSPELRHLLGAANADYSAG